MPFPTLPPPLQHQVDLSQQLETKTRLNSTCASTVATPDFVDLYQSLTSEVLSSDGRVLRPPSRQGRTAGDEEISVEEDLEREESIDGRLRRLWIERTKEAVLGRVLMEVALSNARFNIDDARGGEGGEVMTNDEKQLCYLVAAYLSVSGAHPKGTTQPTGSRQAADEKDDINNLIKHDLDRFRSLLPSLIGLAASTYIEDIEHTLCQMLEAIDTETLGPTMLNTDQSVFRDIIIPPNNPDINTTATPSSQLIQSLDKALHKTNQDLLSHQSSLNLSISHLLSAVQPSTPPSHVHIHRRQEHLYPFSANHQIQEPSPHHLAALKNHVTLPPHLTTRLTRLTERERELSATLAEYDAAGISRTANGGDDGGRETMRALGQRYRVIEAEIGNVKREVEGLEGRV